MVDTKAKIVAKPGADNDVTVLRSRFFAHDVTGVPTVTGLTVRILDPAMKIVYEAWIPPEGFLNARGKANQFKFKAGRTPFASAAGMKRIVIKRNEKKNVGVFKAVAKEMTAPRRMFDSPLSVRVFFGPPDEGECLEAYRLPCRAADSSNRCDQNGR